MKLNFFPFHRHDNEIIRWRLVHCPDYEPSRILIRVKCKKCGKESDGFSYNRRDVDWENNNRDTEGFWFGNENIGNEENE